MKLIASNARFVQFQPSSIVIRPVMMLSRHQKHSAYDSKNQRSLARSLTSGRCATGSVYFFSLVAHAVRSNQQRHWVDKA